MFLWTLGPFLASSAIEIFFSACQIFVMKPYCMPAGAAQEFCANYESVRLLCACTSPLCVVRCWSAYRLLRTTTSGVWSAFEVERAEAARVCIMQFVVRQKLLIICGVNRNRFTSDTIARLILRKLSNFFFLAANLPVLFRNRQHFSDFWFFTSYQNF